MNSFPVVQIYMVTYIKKMSGIIGGGDEKDKIVMVKCFSGCRGGVKTE